MFSSEPPHPLQKQAACHRGPPAASGVATVKVSPLAPHSLVARTLKNTFVHFED